jgi:hypothetical protein
VNTVALTARVLFDLRRPYVTVLTRFHGDRSRTGGPEPRMDANERE